MPGKQAPLELIGYRSLLVLFPARVETHPRPAPSCAANSRQPPHFPADIVFVPYRSTRSPSPHYRYYSLSVRKKFGFRPLICFWNGEPPRLQEASKRKCRLHFRFPTDERQELPDTSFFKSCWTWGLIPWRTRTGNGMFGQAGACRFVWNHFVGKLRLDPLRKVTKFCHFIYRNERAIERQDFFRALTKYKRVATVSRCRTKSAVGIDRNCLDRNLTGSTGSGITTGKAIHPEDCPA